MPRNPAAASKKTIPAMLVETDFLFRLAKEGADPFHQATPFQHLLVSSFLKPSCCLAVFEGLQEWPPTPVGSFYPQQELPSVVRLLLWELSSSTVIRHLATLAGKPPLLPDPFLLHSGVCRFTAPDTIHNAEQEFFARHPENHLLNVLRLELFVSRQTSGTFALELVDAQGKIATRHIASNGCALLVDSDRYRLRYHCDKPADWCSLLAYYYINDRARVLNGQEQPHTGY